jgi:hypothetical protein
VGELLRVAQIVDRDDATIVEGKGHQNSGAQKMSKSGSPGDGFSGGSAARYGDNSMEDKLSKLDRDFGWSDDTSTRMAHRIRGSWKGREATWFIEN